MVDLYCYKYLLMSIFVFALVFYYQSCSMSQPSHNTSAFTIASGDSLLGDSQDSRQSESLVEIETGDSDVSAVLKFIAANQSSTKSHKSSPVWKFFAHFDSAHHLDKKNYRICLVCHDEGSDKAVQWVRVPHLLNLLVI
jgi:hypothetical protein